MARIDIEQKKNVWPWIIGLVVLLLLIWGVAELLDNDDDVNAVPPATTAPATTGTAAAAPASPIV